ncbi:MAG: helix-turn-helix transcriptional regulator [Thermodesulfovibrionaceae bacterium]
MKTKRDIGKIIKEGREKANISQRKLAAMCGISRQHLKNIESGKVDVRISTLAKISEALGIPIIVFFNGRR